MPKIKNWTRRQVMEKGGEMRWRNDKTNKYVVVMEVMRNNKWLWIVGTNPTLGRKVKHIGKFKTKEKARKYAINWMEKHPRG